MKSIAFLLLCLHLIGIIAVNNSTITFLNLLEDELIISSESSSLRSGLSLQSSPQGWMSQYLYSGSGCKSASVYMTVGLIINQCLYSPKYKIYFKASCSSSQASLYYYSDSSCKVQTRSAAVYTLNSCGSYSGVSYSYTMQCTTTNTDTLPLPTTKSLVVVSYYQDSSCSTIVQYSGYAESTCMTGSGTTSFKYNYPTKTTYSSSSSCSGTGSSATLQTSTCFDWVESYGYSDDTTLSPYSPYMIISQQTVTSTPSLTPSYSPTLSPTVSLAPSNTATPTTTPTVAPSKTPNPSASPSWSFAPSTLKPTAPPRGPTRRPTKAPNNPTTAPTTPLDYTITYQIIQSFANTSCSYFTSSSLRTLELLQDSVSSTLTGKEDNAYISVADVTIIPNNACNISYYLTLSSTLSLGYTSAIQAYDTSSWKISSAVSNGDYNSYWSAIAEELELSSYMDMRTISVEFGSYESNLASSSSGSSSSSTDSVTIIASSVVVSLVFIPLMCCVFIRAYRHCNATSLKVGIEQDEEIEMVEARYIDDNIMRDETSREERRLPRLPEARPISCIVGEVAHEV